MVRSLDVQQVLLQSSAVERVQQVQQQQGDAQQRHFHAQLAEEKRELREKVQDAKESGRLRVGEDDERKKRKGAQGSDIEKKEKRKGLAKTGEPEGKIDIRV